MSQIRLRPSWVHPVPGNTAVAGHRKKIVQSWLPDSAQQIPFKSRGNFVPRDLVPRSKTGPGEGPKKHGFEICCCFRCQCCCWRWCCLFLLLKLMLQLAVLLLAVAGWQLRLCGYLCRRGRCLAAVATRTLFFLFFLFVAAHVHFPPQFARRRRQGFAYFQR